MSNGDCFILICLGLFLLWIILVAGWQYLKNQKMKKLLTILVLTIILGNSGCINLIPHPRPWTKSEKTAAWFFVAAHTANAFTTEAHQNHPDMYYEVNPILGRHPTDSEIAGYFSLTGVATLITTHFYPELRKPVLYGYGGTNLYWTIHDIEMMR